MLREEVFRRHRRRPLPLRHLRLPSGRYVLFAHWLAGAE